MVGRGMGVPVFRTFVDLETARAITKGGGGIMTIFVLQFV